MLLVIKLARVWKVSEVTLQKSGNIIFFSPFLELINKTRSKKFLHSIWALYLHMYSWILSTQGYTTGLLPSLLDLSFHQRVKVVKCRAEILKTIWLTHNWKSCRLPLPHFFLCLCCLQDLKPSNLAVNEDCELRVRLLFKKRGCCCLIEETLSADSPYSCSPTPDPGLWPGTAHRRWDDGLRGHAVVPSTWDHAKLDALQHDRCVHAHTGQHRPLRCGCRQEEKLVEAVLRETKQDRPGWTRTVAPKTINTESLYSLKHYVWLVQHSEIKLWFLVCSFHKRFTHVSQPRLK